MAAARPKEVRACVLRQRDDGGEGRGRRQQREDGGDGRGRRWCWSEEETLDLLKLIAQEQVVLVLDGKRQRNAHVFRRLAMLMDKEGYPRTPEQIRVRWKFLKHTYLQDTRKQYGVNGTRTFNSAYLSAMATLMKQMTAKASCSNKPTVQKALLQNGGCSSTAETPGVEMEVFVEPPDEEDEDVEDEDFYADDHAGGAPTAGDDHHDVGRTRMGKIMDASVDCILDEASGTESAELRTLIHPGPEERAQQQQQPSSVQQGIRPRTLSQYNRKDKVADKLIGIMQRQTRLMEEEQKWRREFVVKQQRWEEQLMSTQMKQMETMMVTVTKMIMPMMAIGNPAADSSSSSVLPPQSPLQK